MAMVRIADSLDETGFAQAPRMFTNINSSSPLKHDWPMLDGAMRLARQNQLVIVTPFTLALSSTIASLFGRVGGVLVVVTPALASPIASLGRAWGSCLRRLCRGLGGRCRARAVQDRESACGSRRCWGA